MFDKYDAILSEWVKEGVIEEVPDTDAAAFGHYLPHRHLVKESSTTTPIRPIFDASAKSGNLPSLNQCLERGPNLIEMIPSILLRFRERRIGVIADIRRAFLQISIHPEDRDFLRFLWWKDYSQSEIKVYRHRRVGVQSSPFLLGAVIEYHLEKAREDSIYNHQSLALFSNSFYVDNVVASVNSEEELQQFIAESSRVMADACFDLRGWEYSGSEVNGDRALSNVLGLQWNRITDFLTFQIGGLEGNDLEKITKRIILSVSCKTFDPIGLLCPVWLVPKLILQKMWRLKVTWDEEVDGNTKKEFLQWYQELPLLREVMVPRWVNILPEHQDCEIHTFTDASQVAYAAATYLRVKTADSVQVFLLAAKSRVAPLKDLTIPRMELLAAMVGARLTASILDSLDRKGIDVHIWTDSSTVLSWITRNEGWAVFVGNRVQEIRKLTPPEWWKHIPGEFNPADLPSRGCTAKQLVQARWWEGPEWLKAPPDQWPNSEICFNLKEIEREKSKTKPSSKELSLQRENEVTVTENLASISSKISEEEEKDWFCRYFSNYNRIIRLVGWIRRFCKNCRLPKGSRFDGELSVKEMNVAEYDIIRLIQKESFEGENDIKLSSLKAFEDEQGILRLRTKIIHREDERDFRQPIVLPFRHPVVRRLIMSYHLKHCHAGVNMLLNLIRERYWILKGRKTIRATLSTCAICRRQDSKRVNAPASPLPESRVRDAAVFEITGVDLAGPVYLKKADKAWICLFTCAIYRVVHLELVTLLSSESFIQALRRFIARRGRATVIYSDNGTNFVGTENAFKMLNWDEIGTFSTARRIEWRFNPPSAAWWGGWWERLIRVLKQLLKKTLGKAQLTQEEMTTVLCDSEAVINSRPLTYVAENEADLVPLSPSLFLQDIREVGTPDCDAVNSTTLNRRVKYCQKIKKDLRKRFRSEYLGQLVQRGIASQGKNREIKVGDIVLIEAENLKRLNWPLGRVVETIPGKDGVVRLVRLQTSHARQLLRPIQRIFPLEISTEEPIVEMYSDRRSNRSRSSEETETQASMDEGCASSKPIRQTVTRSGRIVKMPDRLGV